MKPNVHPILETALDEQSDRWKEGDRSPVEDYLARYPALGDDAAAALDLIYQEVLLRRQSGESPRLEDYLHRFPVWSEDLIRLFVVEQAMGTAGERATEEERGSPAGPAGWASLPAAIDGYELLGVLGRGGMGVVYKARDIRLGRVVAIKTIAEAEHTSPDRLGRFLAEAEVVARLQHPHIIQIHAIGEQAGQPYFSLEYVEGGTLARRLAEGPMAPGAAAVLVETLAQAVNAAHHAGIVHRDLKPSNVLLTALGVPKVADFGLAKLLGGDSVRTLSGEALGTPSYMAPEQAEGRSREVGPAADVYALGAIFYHTLTGRPPFLGDSAIETLKLVVSTEVVPPRRQRPGVPRDLETICLKCLEKEPRKRYASSQDLADDLKRFREGSPIVARPIGPMGRLGRWGRRNPTLTATSAALILTFALGTPALLVLWLRARHDHAGAEIARERAERSRDRALDAVRVLLTAGTDELIEEARPYRRALIASGLDESQALVRELEQDSRAELQRVDAYGALAGVQAEGGEQAAAFESVRKAIALAEQLVARDPTSIAFRNRLAHSLHRLAAMVPDEAESLAAARRSTEISKALAADHPDGDRVSWIGQAAMNDYNTGNIHFSKGRVTLALESFLSARAAYQAVIDLGHHSPKILSLAAGNHLYLCRTYSQLRKMDDAIAEGRQAIDLFRSLVAAHPDNLNYALSLNLADQEIGMICCVLERWGEAIKSFESARATLLRVAAKPGQAVSKMALIESSLAVVDENLCEAYDSDPARYAAQRKAISDEAYQICDKLSLVQPLTGNLLIVFAHRCFDRADYQEEDGGMPDLELFRRSERVWVDMYRGISLSDDARAWLVVIRQRLADELACRGQNKDAAEWHRQALAAARGKPALFYELACTYARNAGLTGTYPTKQSASALETRRRRYVENAVMMLREAVADGFTDTERLRNEPALAPIRSTPEFRAFMSDLEFPKQPFARL